jgi:hypothetical protein
VLVVVVVAAVAVAVAAVAVEEEVVVVVVVGAEFLASSSISLPSSVRSSRAHSPSNTCFTRFSRSWLFPLTFTSSER